MTLNIIGIEALAKFIDAMTNKQDYNFYVIHTDGHQSYQPSDKRSFIVEIYDKEEHYVESWDLNQKTYTLEEAKRILEENFASSVSDDFVEEFDEAFYELKEK
jgi:pyruvate-formate lyase-activating enzyme